MRFTQNILLVIVTILIANIGVAGQSTGRPQNTDNIAAIVNGKRVITLEELDATISAELQPLQEQIYALRKTALDNLVTRIVLEEEARRRGISVEQLQDILTPEGKAVSAAEVERVYKENSRAFRNVNADEVKHLMKLDLEAKERLRQYRLAVAALREKASIDLKLAIPPVPVVNITTDGPSRGGKNAPVTVAMFSDFQCPYCKQAIKQVDEILSGYNEKVKFVYKHFPLNAIHKQAMAAAQASVCAQEQGKFWEYQGELFQLTDLSTGALRTAASGAGVDIDKFDKCLSTDKPRLKVKQDMDEGEKAGIGGTPAFIINGKLIRGLQSVEDLKNYIDREMSTLSAGNGK
jgi:protein-disulfide isomerase